MSFGVVIVCSEKDFALAKGCLASVKYFMPNVATCLLIDGDPDYSEAVTLYQCRILQKKDIKNDFLKENSFGWGITKMIAFWESPFESFLLLDADTCMWGDITQEIEWKNNDIIVDQPQYTFDQNAVNTWFFNTESLNEIDKEFEPHKYNQNYFCTGVIFSKRGIFDISWYKELLELNKKSDPIFKFGEMGMLNYMIFKSVDAGRVNFTNHYFQHICPDFRLSHTKALFTFRNNKPVVQKKMVIHYNGNTKPFLKNFFSYHAPMTFFRKRFLQLSQPYLSSTRMKEVLLAEDKVFAKPWPLKERIKFHLQPVLNLFNGH